MQSACNSLQLHKHAESFSAARHEPNSWREARTYPVRAPTPPWKQQVHEPRELLGFDNVDSVYRGPHEAPTGLCRAQPAAAVIGDLLDLHGWRVHFREEWDDHNLMTLEEFCQFVHTPQRTVRDGDDVASYRAGRASTNRAALHHRRRGHRFLATATTAPPRSLTQAGGQRAMTPVRTGRNGSRPQPRRSLRRHVTVHKDSGSVCAT